jgi:hypothetical protein
MVAEPAPVRIRTDTAGELAATFRVALTPPPSTTHEKR